MDAGKSADRGLSRGQMACSGACAVLLLGLIAVVVWGALPHWPLDKDDYARVELGMSKAQVLDILGRPDRRYVKSAQTPDLRPYISCSPQEGAASAETKAAATEVWRWARLLDQKIGVVFDRDGKVIFRWLDY